VGNPPLRSNCRPENTVTARSPTEKACPAMGKQLICVALLTLITLIKGMTQPHHIPEVRLAEKLAELRWQNRVLVLYTPTAEHPEYVKQRRLLEGVKNSLDERDLVQIRQVDATTDAGTRDYARRELRVQPGAFNLLLIGKDGGVKYRSTEATNPQQLFATVDAMPMRQSEMRERGKQE